MKHVHAPDSDTRRGGRREGDPLGRRERPEVTQSPDTLRHSEEEPLATGAPPRSDERVIETRENPERLATRH